MTRKLKIKVQRMDEGFDFFMMNARYCVFVDNNNFSTSRENNLLKITTGIAH